MVKTVNLCIRCGSNRAHISVSSISFEVGDYCLRCHCGRFSAQSLHKSAAIDQWNKENPKEINIRLRGIKVY